MHYTYQCDQLTLLYLSVPLLSYFNKLQNSSEIAIYSNCHSKETIEELMRLGEQWLLSLNMAVGRFAIWEASAIADFQPLPN